jgi:hypothetical protein
VYRTRDHQVVAPDPVQDQVSPLDLTDYRSAGLRPVRFAIRANMRGPISSWS